METTKLNTLPTNKISDLNSIWVVLAVLMLQILIFNQQAMAEPKKIISLESMEIVPPSNLETQTEEPKKEIDDAYNLFMKATSCHQQAQEIKVNAQETGDPELEKKAIEFFGMAAKLYREHLRLYPDDKNSYQISYFYADCLFYSHKFLKAAEQYEHVRDLQDETYRELSTFAVIKSYEYHMNDLLKKEGTPDKESISKSLPGWVLEDKEENRDWDNQKHPSFKPEKIPEIAIRLINSRDKYVEYWLVFENDPTMQGTLAWLNGKIYFDFNHIDEARRRFKKIMKNYPNEEVGSYAATYMIESYRMQQDWDGMEKVAIEILNMNI